MQTVKIQITDAKYKGLNAVASKDGISVDELVQEQMDYYTNCIIIEYISEPTELKAEEKASLNEAFAQAKVDFLASLKEEAVTDEKVIG